MHVYVHIPFCHRICPYCSFVKHTPASTDMRAFIEALLVELHTRLPEVREPADNRNGHNTLYFGGGTPSMLSSIHFRRLINGIYEIFPREGLLEFSFEANPATFTQHKVETWLNAGITRMSLGIQSWDQDILTLLGREHTPGEAEESFRMLRRAGLGNINIDLMFSIPGQTIESWRSTLEKTLHLEPDHISAYNLTYEEDTTFFDQLSQGRYVSDADRDAEFFEITHETLTRAGYRHYETSNFARNDKLSLHNLGYWMGDDYLGIGPGAVSTLNRRRIHNVSDTGAYIESTLSNGAPSCEVEELSDDDTMLERTSLLLRTDSGLPLTSIRDDMLNTVHQLVNENMAYVSDDRRLVLTGRGRLLVDEITLELVP